MEVSSSTSTRRCTTCRRQKQKCSWTRQDDACDRCLEKGFSCPPRKGTPGFRLPTRSLFKCDYCRKAHETCHPVNRKWPDKCEFCVARNYPCTIPRDKREFEDFRVRQEREESISETHVEYEPHPAQNQEVTTFIPSASNIMLEISDSDDTISPISTPDLPPLKRMKEGNRDIQPAAVEEVERLKYMIQSMENEFKEVLKAEQERYEMNIKALKVEHREELVQQRQRYESRIDDLIRIMKNL
ncbi:uncharacterized protein F4807DRAFT_107589 [Annulohypoxylon truncatum]|uniref:uncharacterized protein n=1 Tax=Annulohypoxylon truncatum TaxID=327061 RepID=UPI002007B4AA|nr:uncharacterized protein F4807DRAFT_107589 [Annulohypoxylon truncatum]KAI1209008.1 hypothetical protein F4807DRAFT_107589 [Annulohypoxylon truncatum]